jgi:serine/threonine protein kinase
MFYRCFPPSSPMHDSPIRRLIQFQALDFCHSKGIMHRDVKPHNVMIDHETRKAGQPKPLSGSALTPRHVTSCD